MELADYNAKTQEILAHLDDQGAVTTALAELTTAFNEEIAARATAEKKASNLEKKNNKLKEDNMNLFLRVTVPDKNEPGPIVRPETDNTSVDSLFTNGRLNLKG